MSLPESSSTQSPSTSVSHGSTGLTQGVSRAVDAIGSTANAAGRGVLRVAGATGKGIAAAADMTGKGITAAADVTGKGITAGTHATGKGITAAAEAAKTATGTMMTGVVSTGKAINDAASAEILPEDLFPSLPHSPDNRTADDCIAGTVDALCDPVSLLLPAGLGRASTTTPNDSGTDVQALAEAPSGTKLKSAEELDPQWL